MSDDPENVAAVGLWGRVTWARDKAGRTSALSFYKSLSLPDRTKVQALFKRVADYGIIPNREKFKKLEADLWEFKSFQIRFLGDYRHGREFVVAHGVVKKKDRHSKADVEKARRIRAEHDERLGR